MRKNARVSMKSNVSHILILERAFLVKPESSSRMKNEKRTTTTVGCVPSLVFFVRFSFSLFFRDVSTLMFLHFFNRNDESFRQSLFPSIQECNPSNPPSSSRCALNSLSLLNSLFLPLSSRKFCFVSKAPFFPLQSFLLPLESRAP